MRSTCLLVTLCLGLTTSVAAQHLIISPPELGSRDEPPDTETDEPIPTRDEVSAPARPATPIGRAIAALDADACLAVLRDAHVPFERLDRRDAEGVTIPIRLRGALAGLSIESRGHTEENEILDCRLAVAVLAWADVLRAHGVVGLRHYSTYRPGARIGSSRQPSAHASGMAMDLAIVQLEDGSELDVLEAWSPREQGAPPCEGDGELRAMVCAAVERDLFQVVLTPHHDRAHENHVHLEVRPDVDWSYVR